MSYSADVPTSASTSLSSQLTQSSPASAADSRSTLIDQVIADRYRVVELIGRGGMGAVYRAEHIHIKKSFAFKVLHPELTHQQEAVRRFEREAIAAARIDHPNVATAIDFGNLPTGEFYLVLDYVQGKSLRELLNQEGPLSEARTVRISRQIASALGAAHAANIVHRDLKPDNVMLVESNAEPDFVKVLDFGIAKVRTENAPNEPALTRFGTVFGTPEYMSPEQALGQSVDRRSDLYSLGIMMYEMLSRSTPFADEQIVTVLSRQMTEAPTPLPSVSPELSAIIMRLLAKLPDERPASAEQLIEEFDRLPLARLTDAAQGIPQSRRMTPLATTDTLFAPESGIKRALAVTGEPLTASTSPILPHYSTPPWLKRYFIIAGLPVPWVLLTIAVGLVVVSVTLTLTIGSVLDGTAPNSSGNAAHDASLALATHRKNDQELARLVSLATQGDESALRALENRPESSRVAAEWTAIGAGRARNKNWQGAVEAYTKALTLDAKSPVNQQTLSDLYQAALFPTSSSLSLDTAVKYLGSHGADLVYAVNEAIISGRAPKVDQKAVRQLLDSSALQNQASPGLKLALALDDPKKGCQGYKALLPGAVDSADARSLRALRKLAYNRGCGFLGLQDCYSCLRSNRVLTEATEAAKSRPAPTF